MPILKIAITAGILFAFCPGFKKERPDIFIYDKTSAMREKTPDNVFNNLIRLPDNIKQSEDAKIAQLTGKQQQDLLVTAWKSFLVSGR